ncbi:MAG: GNAT family N-acetyltransferase [Gemmiger sp.]|uniref:GNAT family N-acetyltransferase n=1 Tax=Gemmiger sp. TaxID=2049027 RepID=UPI002E7A4D88|nr:GNAT family N-acetyltransferase [Gemmiger sp.]MEE0801219.1 GNAT family N-acetyltransferase [Gemmiger sp.]
MKPIYKQVTKTRYVEQIEQLAQEIFVQHYHKLTPKVARALADTYQSADLTDDQIHSGTVNYFLIELGGEAVGYFALDLAPAGAVCLSRLFLLEKARGQGIGRGVVAYAQKLAEGDGRSRLYLKVWARDLKAESFCKKCRFRKSDVETVEVLPGVTLELATWEKLWR